MIHDRLSDARQGLGSRFTSQMTRTVQECVCGRGSKESGVV